MTGRIVLLWVAFLADRCAATHLSPVRYDGPKKGFSDAAFSLCKQVSEISCNNRCIDGHVIDRKW